VLVRDGAHASLHANDMASVALDDQLWHAALLESPRPRTAPLAVFDAAAVLRLTLIDAAALAGIAEQALEMAVAHAAERRQFGRAIGSFQAVKHHCANMAIAARLARDQVGFAAIAIDDARDDAALQVDCALLVAGNAALGNAATSIQVHGGMGFSDETHPHLLLKRARLQLAIAGGLEAATARIADASGRGDATAGGQEAAGHAR
jgi:alkylation response protein AidB-like acyl-CoA dehydrogenase